MVHWTTGMDLWTTGMDYWTTGMDYWNIGMDYGNMPVTSLKYQCQPYTCMYVCMHRKVILTVAGVASLSLYTTQFL